MRTITPTKKQGERKVKECAHRRILLICCTMIGIVCAGCMQDSETMIRKKLTAILDDDLESLVADIQKENRSDSIYYSLVSYKKYPKARYSRKAVVDFYFFKNIMTKVRRKYRYHRPIGLWERYYNKYHFISDSSTAPDNE
jgi:hypothetical protein